MLCMPPLVGLSGAFKHGERQAYGVRLLLDSIAEARLSQKQAALIQDLSEPQWSRQCQNVDGAHISYQRVFEFPAEVLKALARSLCEELDLVCIDQKDVRRLIEVNEQIAAALASRQQLPVAGVEPDRRIA